MKHEAHLGRPWTLAVVLSLGLAGLNCSGKSSSDDKDTSSAGGSGTPAGGAGSGAGGSGAGRSGAGRSSGGSDGGASASGGRSANAGAGQTGGSSGVAGTAAGVAGMGAGASGGRAGRGDGGTAGATGGTGGASAAAGGTGGDAGAAGGGAGQADTCSTWEDCTSAVCWEGLDGVRACVDEPTVPPPEECFQSDIDCCTLNSDCTDEGTAWCIPKIATTLSCGGARPSGNSCIRGECGEDADCAPSLPDGATVATCAPRGAFGLFAAKCVYGGCRTDADCTLHDGGECRYDLAATHQGCDLHYVLFCAYPSDPCQERYGSCDSGVMVCAPEDDYQGRHCVQAPPAYP